MVPAEGFEPPTFGLQNRCTTTVLSRRSWYLKNSGTVFALFWNYNQAKIFKKMNFFQNHPFLLKIAEKYCKNISHKSD